MAICIQRFFQGNTKFQGGQFVIQTKGENWSERLDFAVTKLTIDYHWLFLGSAQPAKFVTQLISQLVRY